VERQHHASRDDVAAGPTIKQSDLFGRRARRSSDELRLELIGVADELQAGDLDKVLTFAHFVRASKPFVRGSKRRLKRSESQPRPAKEPRAKGTKKAPVIVQRARRRSSEPTTQ
jgi:hypothetical protein